MSKEAKSLEHIATMLFLMQETVRMDVIATNGRPDPQRIYGQAVAAHWGEARKALGLASKWATAEETLEALQKAVTPAAAAAGPAGPSMSAALDFDMEAWGGLETVCMQCLNAGPATPAGTCANCGAAR